MKRSVTPPHPVTLPTNFSVGPLEAVSRSMSFVMVMMIAETTRMKSTVKMIVFVILMSLNAMQQDDVSLQNGCVMESIIALTAQMRQNATILSVARKDFDVSPAQESAS